MCDSFPPVPDVVVPLLQVFYVHDQVHDQVHGHAHARINLNQNAMFPELAEYLRTVLAPALERQFDKAVDEELRVLLDVPREPSGYERTRDDMDIE